MRYYCVQFCDRRQGWRDLPLYSLKEHEVIRLMKDFSASHPSVALRTQRKPHGWEPPPPLDLEEEEDGVQDALPPLVVQSEEYYDRMYIKSLANSTLNRLQTEYMVSEADIRQTLQAVYVDNYNTMLSIVQRLPMDVVRKQPGFEDGFTFEGAAQRVRDSVAYIVKVEPQVMEIVKEGLQARDWYELDNVWYRSK